MFLKNIIDKFSHKKVKIADEPLPQDVSALQKEYDEAIAYYGQQVNVNWKHDTNKTNENWTLKPEDWGDVSNIVIWRNRLHDIYLALKEKEAAPDVETLRTIDAAWQEWIIERIPIDRLGEKSRLKSENYPKSQWWWWIETLNTLTDADRSTI